jgi:hypothetical protein
MAKVRTGQFRNTSRHANHHGDSSVGMPHQHQHIEKRMLYTQPTDNKIDNDTLT